MATELTLARPYAKAIFAIAKGANNFDEWTKVLDALCVITEDPKAIKIIKNPLISREEKADFIIGLTKKNISEKAENLIKLLSFNNRLEVIPGVKELFEKYKYKELKTKKLTITSAVKLNTTQQKEYIAALSEYFGGQNIEAEFKADKTILGGILVRAGDTVIDFSLKGRLERLGEALAS